MMIGQNLSLLANLDMDTKQQSRVHMVMVAIDIDEICFKLVKDGMAARLRCCLGGSQC